MDAQISNRLWGNEEKRHTLTPSTSHTQEAQSAIIHPKLLHLLVEKKRYKDTSQRDKQTLTNHHAP